MKKILIALVVMVGFAGTAISQTKIVHVKSQMLWDTLSISASAESKMAEFQTMLGQEMADLEADLRKQYADFEKIQATPGTSQTLLAIRQGKIQDKEAEYQKRQQSIQYEMQAYKSELELPIIEMIRDAVAVVAKRDKYDYIMDVNDALFVNEDKDVTDVVLVELLKLEKDAIAKAAATVDGAAAGGGQ
jgi:outer membrane protein